jgi:serine/threonine protein kinase
MKYYPLGSLDVFIRSRKLITLLGPMILNKARVLGIVKDIIKAVNELHYYGVAHGDIKVRLMIFK